MKEQLIIAGPCAAENATQVHTSVELALQHSVDTVRLSLWKPRTRPGGFEGLGEEGIPLLLEVAQRGVRPATEVLFSRQADQVMDTVLGKDSSTSLLLWLGSRNQNHTIQQDVGRAVQGEPRVKLMVKNQMWSDETHWLGIIDHILEGGASPEQLILCHRGFGPSTTEYRNPANVEMALRVKAEAKRRTGIDIPMIFDPSHIAGKSADHVVSTAKTLMSRSKTISRTGFDGLIVEVHPHPDQALTDKHQQLNWDQFDLLLTDLRRTL